MGRSSLVVGVMLAGCGGSPTEGTATGSASSTGDETGALTSTSQPTTSTRGDGDSQSSSSGSAGGDSQSGSSTGDDTTAGTTTATTTDDGATDTTGDTTTMDVTASGTSTGTGDHTTGEHTSTGADESSSSTGAPCVPSPEICNDVDDDCDEQIDNVDVGKDGICDCLSIALVGNEGANPSAEFQAWLEAQGTAVDRVNTDPNQALDAALLANYDIIILDYLVRGYTPAEQAAVQTWVEAGGGLMAMTGFTNVQFVADRPNSLISPMGLSYDTSAGFFSGPVTAFAPHPITADLTSISFYGGLFVDIVDDGVGVNEVIMTLPQGPVGVVQERLDGRLFIFGDEWIEFDSEWKNIPQIQQFWVQTLAYLGPKASCQVPQ